MSEDILIEERDGTVARLVLNRPGARNSLSLALLERLDNAITKLGVANDVHVIVIAAGGTGFCAGHDLKELTAARANADKGRAFFEETMDKCARLMLAIVTCPKPVIAEVHGVATAAGCQLVATCDLAVASDAAQFATPGVNIGLFCSTPMVALSRNVGRKPAMKMLLTGDLISAAKAERIGLINDVVSASDLRSQSQTLPYPLYRSRVSRTFVEWLSKAVPHGVRPSKSNKESEPSPLDDRRRLIRTYTHPPGPQSVQARQSDGSINRYPMTRSQGPPATF